MTAASNSEARKRAQEHVPLAVLLVDEMPFVKCSCNDETKPQSATWLREHWQGSEESGIEALDVVVAQQRAQATQMPVSQPITAAVDSGAIGRLNEHQIDELRRLVHTCTYDCAPDRCAIDEADYDVADAVAGWHAGLLREHTDRALAEVEERIEHGPHRLGHNVSVVCSCVRCEATHACLAIVRAARQEQGR